VKRRLAEHAFTGVVVKPGVQDWQRQGGKAPPRDPRRRTVSLQERSEVPRSPKNSQTNGGVKSAPSMLHRLDGVAGPTQLFPQAGYEESQQHRRYRVKRDMHAGSCRPRRRITP